MAGTAASMYIQIISGQILWQALLLLRTNNQYQDNCHGGHGCFYVHTNYIRPIAMAGTAASTYIQTISYQLPWPALLHQHTYKNSRTNDMAGTAASVEGG